MSSSLEQDYDKFKFARESQLGTSDIEASIEESLQNFNNNSLESIELERCQLCDKKFETRSDRQTHIVLVHLRNLRILVRRIANHKSIRDKSNDSYLLESEHTGNLKITLKKQNTAVGDCLKLKLKKSPVSESFTVVSAIFGSNKESIRQHSELAETQGNDCKNESEEEKTTENTFVNVMLNQEANYDDDDDNLGSEPDNNPLENLERPSMDNNEGDSGVGSDSVNPLEREDQNVDDLQADSVSNVDPAESTENDHEESEALEATCRETIENLKKLGEQSSSRSELLETSEETIEQQKTEEEVEEKSTKEQIITDPIPELRGNSEISIVPRSALMPEQPRRPSLNNVETEILPVGANSNSSFSWTKVTENSSRRNEEIGQEVTDKGNSDNSENAGSLLQNFLIEQQRNQNESNNAPTLETEYVSLERLAETVNTCRVCNEKFKDIAHLDAHRSKAGHYQCNIPDCSSLVFTTPAELSTHKSQAHVAPASPSLSISPHLSQNSPHSSRSPHLNQASPHLNSNSPHSPSVQSSHAAQGSPITSPHANSPSYSTQSPTTYPPVSLEQLPAPVQQLAQQVQRMPLPHPQVPAAMPAGVNMTSGGNYYQAQGRPPMYRVQAPIQYPPHLAQMYPQYGGAHYGQMGMQSQMQPQALQQMSRARFPTMVPGQRAPRMPQVHVSSPVPRPRLKRPMMSQPGQMPQQLQNQNPGAPKQRRMDVLLPGGNEDADCHVIAQQKRNDGLPVIQNVQGGASVQTPSRSDSTIHLTDSITLSVRQPGHNPAQVNATVQGAKKPDASAVANVLAARGITVTPAASRKSLDQSGQMQPQQQQQQTQQQKQLTTFNLNSAISIIPARKQQDQQGQFAVPQNKQNKQTVNEVERPPRPPTVDLTQDSPSLPIARRGRPPRMPVSLTCQVCDKRFQSQEILAQHMATHRTNNKLHHKCNLCPAQYPTAQALATHKNTYHRESDASSLHNGNIELALPVVDLKSPQTLNRLAGLGIKSYIPLSQLSAQTGGYFALPIVSIDGARNPNSSNLAALGAASILSLGPLKHLSNR